MSRRVRIVIAAIAAVCYSVWLWRRISANRRIHALIPANHYEQITAQVDAWVAGKITYALDEPQVLASVQMWLDSLGEE